MNSFNAIEMVQKYGAPLFVYDGNVIEQQFKRMQDAFDVKQLQINYACKANTNINILKILNKQGAGLDCVSIEEVQLGLKAGFNPKQIIFTPNCVALEEYEMAMQLGVHINIDSISILEQFGAKYPNHPVGIRINPHVMGGMFSKISVGHIDSKFGISIHQMPHVLRIIEENGQKIEGLHMHTGSDILDIEIFLNAVQILLDVAINFKYLKYLDFGSGYKVPYKPGDMETNIEAFGERFSVLFNSFCKTYGRYLTLTTEPGKYLVSKAGFFFVKTNVIKQTTSTLFACVGSGFNHLVRPMMYDAYHHIENISGVGEKERIYSIVGNICESDTFGVNRRLKEVKEGDILAFHNAGAYCFSMSSQYNSRVRPAEVLVYNGKDYLIRERETLKDILRNQVDLTFE